MRHSARPKNTSRRGLPPQRQCQQNQNRRASQRHEESYTQTGGKLGDHSDRLGARRSPERSECKEDAPDFVRTRSIPSREPGNKNGIDTRAPEASQENGRNGNRKFSGRN